MCVHSKNCCRLNQGDIKRSVWESGQWDSQVKQLRGWRIGLDLYWMFVEMISGLDKLVIKGFIAFNRFMRSYPKKYLTNHYQDIKLDQCG